jgi:GNAT superfamily N-acetyltransferase
VRANGEMADAVRIVPAGPEQWPDLEALFGERGAVGGCWCMWWRLKRSEFEAQKGDGNREALRAIVQSGDVPGLLAYVGDQPAGWCAVAPRDAYPVLDRSRILKRVDDRPVWSVVCFFIAKPYRRTGLTVRLLAAAVEHAAAHGAEVVEGYPVEPGASPTSPAFAWTGFAAAFRKAGFREVARRSDRRPIMRYEIQRTM